MLIAIEGVDGAGKSTQVGLLSKALVAIGHEVTTVSFPRYSDPIFGDLIRRFLRGELGELSSVHPRLVAMLFAGDRGAEAPALRQALCEDKVVICDRYFYSNLAYQAARIDQENEITEFARWLRKLEYGHYAIPVPACSIYLDVHHDQRRRRLAQRTENAVDPRGAVPNDIHERDMDLQARVEQVFRLQSEVADDIVRIDCESLGELMSPEQVHHRIVRMLSVRGLLAAPVPDALGPGAG